MGRPGSEPIACTLNDVAAAGQVVEWADLQRLATEVTPIRDGARMRFPVDHSDQVEDLAERERACCAFLTITTGTVGDEFQLEVTAEDPQARAVITLLAGDPSA